MKIRSAFESLFILVLLIAGIAILPNDQFHEWYDTHHAQIIVIHNTRYFNDDLVGNFFSWIGDNVLVPMWNHLFASDAIRNFVAPAIAAGIIGGLAFDVVKSFLQSEKGESNE